MKTPNKIRALLKTHFENLKRRFFSETRQQKRSLAALNEYFANAKGILPGSPLDLRGEVSGKKIASKLKQGFLEVPISSITTLKPYSLNKYKRRLYRKRKHYQKAFGRGQDTRLFELFYDYSRKALPPRWEVSVKNTKGKIYLRPNTSDTATFEQVFVAKEYEVPFDFSPETIIDGGANVGFATLFFANKYPQAQILAIEPDRSNMEVLCLNTEPYENVKKIQSAIWSHTTHLRIENPEVEKWAFKVIESEVGQPDSFRAYSIEQLIAKMGWESADLLKLDIEGSEISVFGGGYERWLPKVKMLMIELHEKISPGCTKVLEEALSKYPFEKMENGENLIYYQKEFMKGKKA